MADNPAIRATPNAATPHPQRDNETLVDAVATWMAEGQLDDPVTIEMLGSELARLIRSADARELIDTAVALDDAASASTQAPTWSFAASTLESAADAVGESALPMQLRGHAGKSEQILRCLGGRGGTMPRGDLATELGSTSDSHLSHILRDLEDAGLVSRSKSGRETVVLLTALGRQALGAQTEEQLMGASLETMTELVMTNERTRVRLLHREQRGTGFAGLTRAIPTTT